MNNTLLCMAYQSTKQAIEVLERALPTVKDKTFVIAKLAKLRQSLISLGAEILGAEILGAELQT